MKHKSSRRLERIANITSIAVAALFALTIPIGYFLVSYTHTTLLLEEQAEVAAHAVSEMVYEQPKFWVYQENRITDMVLISNRGRTDRHFSVLNQNNEVVVNIGKPITFPKLTVESTITDNGQKTGTIQVSESLAPLYSTTLFVSFAGLLISWLIHYLLKVLPFARLRKVLHSLAMSQQQLRSEIKEKEIALQDITSMSEAMRHQAMHDALTGLPNRAYFNEFAEKQFNHISKNDQLAILILDLNRFKIINDSLGHQAGDELLKKVSVRLQSALYKNAFLARLGGDEFAMLLHVENSDEAILQCKAISENLHQHIMLEEYYIAVHGSIGIACYPQHGNTISDLMRCADMAMYQAKASGDLYCTYSKSFDKNSPDMLSLTADLRQALDNRELFLVYQPKVELISGRLIGVEALLRWDHKEHGFISPEMFIQLAEASGMINDLSKMVMQMSLLQVSMWRQADLNINMAINISARNLQDESLVPYVKSLLDQHQVNPEQLTLEITESNIMIDPEKAQRQIASLSQCGIKIAVDDYGTGYSSLAYLTRLEIDELKIDKSFVLNMLHSNDDRVIVHSTVEMARKLGITVVAEGIENLESANLLQEFGCKFGQGYHYCKPVKAIQLMDFLKLDASPVNHPATAT